MATKDNVNFRPIESRMFKGGMDHGRVAYKAYMAIYANHGDHVIIAAPTLDLLAKIWEPIAHVPLNRENAQEVYIVSAKVKP